MEIHQAQSLPSYRMINDTLVYILLSMSDYFFKWKVGLWSMDCGEGNLIPLIFQIYPSCSDILKLRSTYIEEFFVLYFGACGKSDSALVSKMIDQVRNRNVYVIYKRIKERRYDREHLYGWWNFSPLALYHSLLNSTIHLLF